MPKKQTVSLQLANGYDKSVNFITDSAFISVEQPGLIIPQSIALKSRLDKIGERFLYGYDDEKFSVSQVGTVIIKTENYQMICSALVWAAKSLLVLHY